MQKLHLFVIAALVVTVLGCTITIPSSDSFQSVTGSGEIVTLTPDLADFDQVDVGYAFQATIEQGDTYAVTIRIDDNLAQYLDVRVVGRTLVVGLEPSIGFNFGAKTLEAEITMPEIVSLDASGASRVSLTGFESEQDLRIDASGASTISGDIAAADVEMRISGASTISLDGSGDRLNLEGSGASTANLRDFAVSDARVELSGASRGTVNASGTLDVEASGASHLTYAGNPQLGSVNTSGASSIEQE
jgi:hypothetical protein